MLEENKAKAERPAVRLITFSEAVEHINCLLADEDIDPKQRLLCIAAFAIAAMISLQGDSTEVESIEGLQEYVNRLLFVDDRQ